MTLPEGWVEATIDDLAEYLNGMAFKPCDWGDEGVGIIRIQNLTDISKTLNRTIRKFDERYRVRSGDILVSWSATLDAYVWDREDAVLNQHIFKVTPSEIVDKNFLFHLLRIVIRELEMSEHLHGSTMKHINRGPFLAKRVALPPLAQQRRIVAKLAVMTGCIERIRAKVETVRALCEKLRDVVLKDELSIIFQHGTAQASDLFSWSSGKFLPRKSQIPGDVCVYGGNGVNGFHNEYNVEYPTLVVGRVGAHCGNVHVTSGPAWITDNAIYARNAAPNVHLGMALYVFREARLGEQAGGTGQPYVNQDKLNSVRYPSCDYEKQHAAFSKITSAFARADRLEAEATRARALLDRLEAAILAKAFRGELVPQDPNDEPASVLLDRIRAERAAAPKPRRGRARKAMG